MFIHAMVITITTYNQAIRLYCKVRIMPFIENCALFLNEKFKRDAIATKSITFKFI